MIKLYNVLSVILVFFSVSVFAQGSNEVALRKCNEALQLEQDGKFNEALVILTDAQKLDPTNIKYIYEITYCYYKQGNFQKVISVLSKLKKGNNSFDRLYELLGNSYDALKAKDSAVMIYDEGLTKFPNSGCLHLEKGIVLMENKRYNEALSLFEKGIEVQPTFVSNYYWAAKLYYSSNQFIWCIMYGEIFMNLERNSKRTEELSRLLFNSYRGQIKSIFLNDNLNSKYGHIKLDSSLSKNIPYNTICDLTLKKSLNNEKEIDPNSLNRIRSTFLRLYLEKGINTIYPNILLSYQYQIYHSGNMDAYNHWVLMIGNERVFSNWKFINKVQWSNFNKWIIANPLKIDYTKRFYKAKFDQSAATNTLNAREIKIGL